MIQDADRGRMQECGRSTTIIKKRARANTSVYNVGYIGIVKK